MNIRPMTPGEEVNLAMVVTARDVFSLEAALELAAQRGLPSDLVDLVHAGLACDEIEDDVVCCCRYRWLLPVAAESH